MANAYNYSNVAQATTLSGSISAGATTITVGGTTGFPSTTPYILALDYGAATEELVSVTAVAGFNLTVTRGFGGTSAQSHSLGAVVRHVVNAQDLIDFRTHEDASSGVHGITGSVVGTTDTQTLTNKTLTSPTVNAGALSGTFTGNPVLSGTPNFTGAVQSTRSAAADVSLAAIVSGDTFDRFRAYADGKLEWGPGNATRDITMRRDAANQMSLENALLRGVRSATTLFSFGALVSGDSVTRFGIRADGRMLWGDGSATQDTNLYRSAADTLRTDGSLIVGTNLTVSNIATVNTLDVTTLTPGSTDISSGSLLAASTGWSISALSAGVLKAGFVTVNLNFSRTGADITINAAGAPSTGIVQMGTINASYLPKSTLGTMYIHAGNSIATGTARITASTGAVELVRWQASQTIATGNTISATVTYAL